jgi:hypothetical protein
MEKIFLCIIVYLSYGIPCQAQSVKISKNDFFLDERPVEMVLSTDIRSLGKPTKTPVYQPAMLFCRYPDSSYKHELIKLKRRGKYRNEKCYLASILLNFKNPTSPSFSKLDQLKWVGGCSKGDYAEQLILKEFLAYKIYNLLTGMSYRVRLIKATYKDTLNKVKPYSQYAFLIEDTKNMAKRNKCVEIKSDNFHTEHTNRNQMTLAAMFEYMIGNTDWSVTMRHNIKLIVPKKDTLSRPYTIPYDFDHSGFVNANYAVPPEQLGIRSVTNRVYRGYARNIGEIESIASLFNQKKPSIDSLINYFVPLNEGNRKMIQNYLEGFFEITNNKNKMKEEFINKARVD